MLSPRWVPPWIGGTPPRKKTKGYATNMNDVPFPFTNVCSEEDKRLCCKYE